MYVRISPASLFSGPILQGLWTCAAIVALIVAAYVIQMRRGPADAES
jgi:acyl dehydratase